MPKKNVERYIAAAPPAARGMLRQLQGAIQSAAPQAEEKISYGMPYYEYKGRLAYFAAFRGPRQLFCHAQPPDTRDLPQKNETIPDGQSHAPISLW